MFHRSSYKDGPIGRAILSLLLVASAVICTLSIIIIELLYIWQTFGVKYFLTVQLLIFLASGAIMVLSLNGNGRQEKLHKLTNNNKGNHKTVVDNDEMENMQIQYSFTTHLQQRVHHDQRTVKNDKKKKTSHQSYEIEPNGIDTSACDSSSKQQRTRKKKKRERKQLKKDEKRKQSDNSSMLILQDVMNTKKLQNEGSNSPPSKCNSNKSISNNGVNHKSGAKSSSVKFPLALDRLRGKDDNGLCNSNSSGLCYKQIRCTTKNKENLHKISMMNRFTKKLSEEWLETNLSCSTSSGNNSTYSNSSFSNLSGIDSRYINSLDTSNRSNMSSFVDFKMDSKRSFMNNKKDTSLGYQNTSKTASCKNFPTISSLDNMSTSVQHTTCKTETTPYFGQIMNDFNDNGYDSTNDFGVKKNDNVIFESSSFFSSPAAVVSENEETSSRLGEYQSSSYVSEYSLFGSSKFNNHLVWSPLGL